jgi:hypothetical protein
MSAAELAGLFISATASPVEAAEASLERIERFAWQVAHAVSLINHRDLC